MTPQIFVSYASSDRSRVAPIVEHLERHGWSVWWDRRIEPGRAFDREIEQALSESQCVVVCWTAASIDSDWVLAEANEALERGILVPVILDEIRPPLAFRRTQSIVLRDSDEGIGSLVEAIRRLVPPDSRKREEMGQVGVEAIISVRSTSADPPWDRVNRLLSTFRGRVESTSADRACAYCPSAVGAVRAALEMQRKFTDLHVGVHQGSSADGDTGSAETVAEGLADLASEGAICVSDFVYQLVRRRLELEPAALGEKSFAGAESVLTYAIEPDRAVARAAQPTKVSIPEKPSLAVVPFRNMSGDPEQEYFSDGLTLDLIAELVRMPGLFVISSDSMATYKDSRATPREIAKELGVRHVLEGTVRKIGSRVRISAQLINGETGRVDWSERYDRDLEDVFAIQDEITDKIVAAMDIKLYSGEGAITTRYWIKNPQARESFYRGNDLMTRLNKADMAAARRMFQETIQLEPDSPLPYAMVAWTHFLDFERGWSESPQGSLDAVEEFANESLVRGDGSGMGHMMLGHAHLLRREYGQAMELSALSVDERPSCPTAYSCRANILNYCGEPAPAIEAAKQAIRISPVAQTLYPEALAVAYFCSGNVEEALDAANQALALAPDSVDARVVMAAALVESGRQEAAREIAQDISRVDATFDLERFAATHPFRDEQLLDRLIEALRQAGVANRSEIRTSSHAFSPRSRRRVAPRPRR